MRYHFFVACSAALTELALERWRSADSNRHMSRRRRFDDDLGRLAAAVADSRRIQDKLRAGVIAVRLQFFQLKIATSHNPYVTPPRVEPKSHNGD